LAFFHNLYTEYKSPGSYLDYAENLQGGGYVGTLYGAFDKMAVPNRYTLKQRTVQKATKNADLLRYWIEASTGCTVPGAFSDQKADGAIASRAVISASAVIRPALRYIAEKISSADDVSASKLFIPVMKMIRGVMKRFLMVQDTSSMDAGEVASLETVKSACIKFLEIVVLCFSLRSEGGSTRRGKSSSSDDFALEDLPMGHPTITRQSLEEIGEDAFTVLRGLTLIGGQVRVESGLKSDVIMSLGLDFSGKISYYMSKHLFFILLSSLN
jgi:symplekin